MVDQFELPQSIIARLVKQGATAETNAGVIISKDTKEAFQQVSGLFVLYLSSTANDIAKEKKRSKVTADDVFSALKELGFDKFEESLKEFIKNYNSEKEDLAREQKEKKRIFVQAETAQEKTNAD